MYIDDDGSAGDAGELNIDVDGHQEAGLDYTGLADQDMVLDTDHGSFDIGPATVDTSGDGHADTVMAHDVYGDTVLYTDSTGDGHADIATELTPDGDVIIADHTDHGWLTTQHGDLDVHGEYHAGTGGEPFTPPVPEGDDPITEQAATDAADDAYWSGWAGAFTETGSAPGVVRIDSTTGQWISRN